MIRHSFLPAGNGRSSARILSECRQAVCGSHLIAACETSGLARLILSRTWKARANAQGRQLQEQIKGEALGKYGKNQLDMHVAAYLQSVDDGDGEAVSKAVGVCQQDGNDEPAEMRAEMLPPEEEKWARKCENKEEQILRCEEVQPEGKRE